MPFHEKGPGERRHTHQRLQNAASILNNAGNLRDGLKSHAGNIDKNAFANRMMTNSKIRIAYLARLTFPLLAISAAVLGMWGFLENPASLKSWHEAAVKTLQLFLINVAPSDMKTNEARIASLLAPAAMIGAAFFAFSERLRRNYWILRLRLFPPRNLFLGNGDTAAAIASHLVCGSNVGTAPGWHDCNAGLDTLVETPLSQSQVVVSGRWFLQQGDARSPADLRRLNAGRAGNIWILAGNDVRNLEIARRIQDLHRDDAVAGSLPPARMPRLLIAVNNRETIRVRHTLLGDSSDLDLEFFSIPRLAARALLLTHPPRIDGRPVNIAVIGGGPLAEAIVVQAATHLVYSENPSDSVRICLIGSQAQKLSERIVSAFPALDPASATDPAFASLLPLASVSVHTCETADIQPAFWMEIQAGIPFSAVYVAGEDDLATVGATIRVAALRDQAALPVKQPIVACLKHDDRAASIDFYPDIENCYQFRLFEEFRSGEIYPGEARDQRAKLVNHYYQTGGTGQQGDIDAMLQDADRMWKRASHEDRWSSRLSADHFDVKLATAGLSLDALQTAEGLERFESAVPFLARLEHRRFVAERLLDGWLPYATPKSDVPSKLDYGQQKAYLRLNKTLVPFDDLPDSERSKDYAVIRAMLHFSRLFKPMA